MKTKIGLIILISIKFCETYSNNDVNMIVDVVRSYDKPIGVIANVNWKSAKKVELSSKIMKLRPPRTVKYAKSTKSINYVQAKDVLMVIDVEGPNFFEFMITANSSSLFQKPYMWLIFGQKTKIDTILKQMDKMSMLIDSEIIIAQFGDDDIFKLYMVYKLSVKGAWYMENYGTWNLHGFYKSEQMKSSSRIRRKNLHQYPIVTSVPISYEKTKNNLHEIKNLHIDSVAKATYHLCTPLYEFINATRGLIYTLGWAFKINGTWTGIIRHFELEEADLSGASIRVTAERQEFAEYLIDPHPGMVSPIFVFRRPPLSYQNNLFFLPFKTIVWGCTCILIILITIILYINAKWESYKARINEIVYDGTRLEPTISDIAILIIGAISQQGSYSDMKGSLGRFVSFTLFMCFVFLYTSYSANIVVLLQSSSNQIRTFSDLLNSKLELGVEDTLYNRGTFGMQPKSSGKSLFDIKLTKNPSVFVDIKKGVTSMQQRPYALYMTPGSGYWYVQNLFYEHEKCELQEVYFDLKFQTWLSARKQSPFKEILKVGLLRLLEHGFTERVNKQLFSKQPTCSSRGGNFASVTMIDFYPALLILAYGMIASVFLFFIEVLFKQIVIRHEIITSEGWFLHTRN